MIRKDVYIEYHMCNAETVLKIFNHDVAKAMEELQMNAMPVVSTVNLERVKKEEEMANSEEDESEGSDEWSRSLVVDAPVLEPLVKIEEAEGVIQTDFQNVKAEQDPIELRMQTRKQKLQRTSSKDLPRNREVWQKAEVRDHSDWKALTKGNICLKCGRLFTALGRLRQHVLTHLSKPVAGKVTATVTAESELKNNSVEPSETTRRRYTCSLCSKMFIREAHLKRHILVHTGERPHRCQVCHKCFTVADDLKVHLRVHTGERPHQCSACNKAFTTAGNLKVHLRVHSGERPFRCGSCTKCFTRAAALKKHQRQHTGRAAFL